MSFQWIGLALVKLPDGTAVEPVLIDFKVGAEQQLRWKLLHRKSYGLGGRFKSLVTNRTSTKAPAPGWKELCLGIVIDCSHCYCTSAHDRARDRGRATSRVKTKDNS